MISITSYPHRTICGVLEEIRKLDSTRNYSPLPGLIEELQSLANRMEASLDNQKDYFRVRDAFKKKKKKLLKLEKQIKQLEKTKAKLDIKE